MRWGGRSCRRTAVAAAASGGDTIAPRAMAAAHGMAGTRARTTTATTNVVRSTLTMARLATATQLSRRSRGDESYAASNSTGATKSASATAGSIVKLGAPGRNARAAPPSARNAGYGAPTLRAMAARSTATSNTLRTDSNPVIRSTDYDESRLAACRGPPFLGRVSKSDGSPNRSADSPSGTAGSPCREASCRVAAASVRPGRGGESSDSRRAG